MESVEALQLPAGVHVRIAKDAAPPAAAAGTPVHAEWARQCALNPRLHHGAVLSVVSLDAERGEVLVKRETYQRYAVQPRVMTGVRLLAVTAVMTARDDDGNELVMLGRRGEGVRMYPGMWELGPAGGVGVPAASVMEMDSAQLMSHLADEVEEEVGLLVDHGVAVAVVRDHVARSDDVVFRVDVGRVDHAARVARPANWEYSETRWVRDIAAFAAMNEGQIIGPTRALFRLFGWT